MLESADKLELEASMLLTVSPNAAERLATILEQQAGENEMSKCVAGNGYDRTDYECYLAANTFHDFNACTTRANKHIKY